MVKPPGLEIRRRKLLLRQKAVRIRKPIVGKGAVFKLIRKKTPARPEAKKKPTRRSVNIVTSERRFGQGHRVRRD